VLSMASKKNRNSTPAELSLVHIRKCLVNLPASLVSMLMSIDTVSFLHLAPQ